MSHSIKGFGLTGSVNGAVTYEPGERVRSRFEIETLLSDEFGGVGLALGAERRSQTLGSLILRTHDESGRLHYSGHVATGFVERTPADLLARL